MNPLSAITASTHTSNASHQVDLSGDYAANTPQNSEDVEALHINHLQMQAWKGCLLLSITLGMFVLAPLNVTGALQARVSKIVSSQTSLIR